MAKRVVVSYTGSSSGGVSTITTGNTLWVDIENGNDTTAQVDRQDKPYETIAAAVADWTSGSKIHVRPGTYDEQIEITSGMYLYFELGAIVNYTGSGATFKTTGDDGQVKIGGQGRFYHTGTQATQYVFEIGDEAETEEHWHVDVSYEDCRCLIGRSSEGGAHGLMGLGTSLANAAARSAAAPVAIGEHGYQLDTKVHYIATGTSAGNWTALNAAAVKVNSGYIMLRGHSVDGVNCHGIRWLSGSFDVQNERTTATGYGCNAFNGGRVGATQSPNINQCWLTSFKIASDPNEFAIYLHDTTTNTALGNVIYFTTKGIYGNFEDLSTGIAVYVTTQLSLPQYGNGYVTTKQYVWNLSGVSSFYSLTIQDMVGDTASTELVYVGTAGALLNANFGRMEPFGGTCLNAAAGQSYISCTKNNGDIYSTGGTLILNGGLDDLVTNSMVCNQSNPWGTRVTISGSDDIWNDGSDDYSYTKWSMSVTEERGDIGATSLIVDAISGAYFAHGTMKLGILQDGAGGEGYIVSHAAAFRTVIGLGTMALATASDYQTAAVAAITYMPISAALNSWAAISRFSGFDAFVASPTSANLAALMTNETGSGLLVFATSPTLVTPILGTPTSGTLTNCTGLPAAGVTGLGTMATETATNYLARAGGQMTASIRHTESTVTPSGASPSQTIALTDSNSHTLACTSSTGTIAVTLTRPTGAYNGRIIVKVHASTATGITWAASAGTLYWLGTQPTWTGLAVGKRLVVTVTCDGTDTYLAATEVNS